MKKSTPYDCRHDRSIHNTIDRQRLNVSSWWWFLWSWPLLLYGQVQPSWSHISINPTNKHYLRCLAEIRRKSFCWCGCSIEFHKVDNFLAATAIRQQSPTEAEEDRWLPCVRSHSHILYIYTRTLLFVKADRFCLNGWFMCGEHIGIDI